MDNILLINWTSYNISFSLFTFEFQFIPILIVLCVSYDLNNRIYSLNLLLDLLAVIFFSQ